MYGQQPIQPQFEESPFADIRRKIMQQMLMAQMGIPSGMQKHYIDKVLFGNEKAPPQESEGQRFKGQVGTTVMSLEEENKLRMRLKEFNPNLSPGEVNRMILNYKTQRGYK